MGKYKNDRRYERKYAFKKTAIGLVIIGIGCILLISSFKGRIGANIDAVSQLKAKGMITTVINETIKDEFTGKKYDENFFLIKTGKDGKVQMVQANTALINQAVSGLASSLQKKYDEMGPQSVKVSYGTLLGSKVLSQLNWNFKIGIQPLSVSNWDFTTEFESQGINQTKYKIYIVLESNVRILQPFSSSNLNVKNKVLISEAVIVGDVPDSYVNVPKEDILDAIN